MIELIQNELDREYNELRREIYYKALSRYLTILERFGFQRVKTISKSTDEFLRCWILLERNKKYFKLVIAEDAFFTPEFEQITKEFAEYLFEEEE